MLPWRRAWRAVVISDLHGVPVRLGRTFPRRGRRSGKQPTSAAVTRASRRRAAQKLPTLRGTTPRESTARQSLFADISNKRGTNQPCLPASGCSREQLSDRGPSRASRGCPFDGQPAIHPVQWGTVVRRAGADQPVARPSRRSTSPACGPILIRPPCRPSAAPGSPTPRSARRPARRSSRCGPRSACRCLTLEAASTRCCRRARRSGSAGR